MAEAVSAVSSPVSGADTTVKEEQDHNKNAKSPDPLKLPPCDQCRRRKVKCDGRKIPCER
jgi:hypothetical protein